MTHERSKFNKPDESIAFKILTNCDDETAIALMVNRMPEAAIQHLKNEGNMHESFNLTSEEVKILMNNL